MLAHCAETLDDDTRALLQALIQIASAMHKVCENVGPRGALHLLERASGRLAALPDDDAVNAARAELKESFGVELTEIGAAVEGEGLTAVDAQGDERTLEATGWDHFR